MLRFAAILSFSALPVVISTDATAQPVDTPPCYAVDASGTMYDLTALCYGSGSVGASANPPPISSPRRASTTQAPTSSGTSVQRSTTDNSQSSRNSQLRLLNLRREGDYIRGTVFNQGQKPADYIQIQVQLMTRDGVTVWSGAAYPDTITLEPQQRTEFDVYLPYTLSQSSADQVRGTATWTEYN